MKPLVITFALFSLVLGGHSQAQQLPLPTAPIPQIDMSQFQPVPSPNRTDSRTWITSGNFSNYLHLGNNGGASNTNAIVWVDLTGKTIGRAIGNFAILTTYNYQLAALTGLEGDRSCNSANVCTFPTAGSRWSPFFSVYYLSDNCTGTPYHAYGLPYGGLGTPYVGIPVLDGNDTYIYLFKVTDTTRVTVNSAYVNNSCRSVSGQYFPSDAAPVTAVVPASAFGIAPFFLK